MNQPAHSTANRVEEFFRSLERETAEGNFGAIAERYAENFMAASPGGARIAPRSVFVDGLPQRKAMFDKLGAMPAKLISLETSELDGRYTLAKGRWLIAFARPGSAPQEVLADSTYIVDTGEEPYRIILYVASQDLPKLLVERGIMPA